MVTVKIMTSTTVYLPPILSGLTWSTERKSSPGKVSCQFMYDESMEISEGDIVSLWDDNTEFFRGYIFTIKLASDGIMSITAYDQLRYFKNKDTRIYSSLTADGLLRSIASDYGLSVGGCDSAGYSITRVEEDAELFDVMNDAIADTVLNSGELFVLYDDCGKLRLRNIKNLRLNLVIRDTSAESYEISSSIDSEVYNQIKLAYGNEDEGSLQYYIAKDSDNIARWGLLQKYESISSTDGAQQQALTMLSMYNQAVKTMSVKGVFGDVSVRAGTSLIRPYIDGDTEKYRYMLVESAKHSWNDGVHLMDLTLKGGDI